jgi:hypothetical protein
MNKFEVLMAGKILMWVFWVATLYGLVGSTASIFRAAIKMDAVCSPETLVSTYKSTQSWNPAGQ